MNHFQVKQSNSVVIVGGGAVGIELAGEIRDSYPSKRITLVHSKPELISGLSDPVITNRKFVGNALAILEAMNVEVMLEERVSNLGELKLNRRVEQTVATDTVRLLQINIGTFRVQP